MATKKPASKKPAQKPQPKLEQQLKQLSQKVDALHRLVESLRRLIQEECGSRALPQFEAMRAVGAAAPAAAHAESAQPPPEATVIAWVLEVLRNQHIDENASADDDLTNSFAEAEAAAAATGGPPPKERFIGALNAKLRSHSANWSSGLLPSRVPNPFNTARRIAAAARGNFLP